jgi:hypothetical protein
MGRENYQAVGCRKISRNLVKEKKLVVFFCNEHNFAQQKSKWLF